MKNIDIYTEEFNIKHEQFIIGCDAIEEEGLWNKEEYGEMEAFYSADMTCIIIRLIASDGRISEKEVDYLNKNFGFDYDLATLTEVFESMSESLGSSFDEAFVRGAELLKTVNEKLALAYRELLALACDIIIASDGVVTSAELDELKRVKSLFA